MYEILNRIENLSVISICFVTVKPALINLNLSVPYQAHSFGDAPAKKSNPKFETENNKSNCK
ncbi:MAG: hypothetical protein STSR0008_25930 [Ignavibacterium sp.]